MATSNYFLMLLMCFSTVFVFIPKTQYSLSKRSRSILPSKDKNDCMIKLLQAGRLGNRIHAYMFGYILSMKIYNKPNRFCISQVKLKRCSINLHSIFITIHRNAMIISSHYLRASENQISTIRKVHVPMPTQFVWSHKLLALLNSAILNL